jgi:hypothetical protein
VPAAPAPRRLHRRPALLGVAALLLALTACAPPGQVRNYNETVRQNYVSRCVEANTGDGQSQAETTRICECWFGKVQEAYDFDEFKRLDSDLREAVRNGTLKTRNDLQTQFRGYHDLLVESGCETQGPQAPTAS